MEVYSLFYLDDEKDDLIIPIKKRLESTGELNVVWNKPKGFENDMARIEDEMKHHHSILLDLQLDAPQEDGSQVKYQAPPLAQQIRTLASLEKIPDLPIILCSTAEKIKESFKRDFTSHDLFDWTFLKMEINSSTIAKIVTIISAYNIIRKTKKDFNSLLQRDSLEIDERILSRFINEENPPIHEIARTIFKDIVQPPGVLINEKILAARLGINITESPAWETIKDGSFSKAKYTGIFSSMWERWWADKISDIFENLSNENLGSLNAPERVEYLKKIFGVKELVAAEPLKFCNSTNFWSICEVTKYPIDPFEGYKIDMKKEPKAWQEYSYVSMYALMERLAEKEGIFIHPSERERFKLESENL